MIPRSLYRPHGFVKIGARCAIQTNPFPHILDGSDDEDHDAGDCHPSDSQGVD